MSDLQAVIKWNIFSFPVVRPKPTAPIFKTNQQLQLAFRHCTVWSLYAALVLLTARLEGGVGGGYISQISLHVFSCWKLPRTTDWCKPEETQESEHKIFRWMRIILHQSHQTQTGIYWDQFWCQKKKKKIRHDSHVWGSVSLTFPLCHFSVKAGETQIFSLIDWVWLCWFEQLRQTFSPQWWNSFIFTHMPLHCVASVSHPHPFYLLKISTGQMDTDASTSVSWQISLFCWSHHPAHIYLKYLEQKGCLEFQHSVIQLRLGCRWKI